MTLHCDKCDKLRRVKKFALSEARFGTNLYLCEPCMDAENHYRLARNLELEPQDKFFELMWANGKGIFER